MIGEKHRHRQSRCGGIRRRNRSVGCMSPTRHGLDDAALAPAEEDVGLHNDEAAHLANLPDAAFLHEAIVERRNLPPSLFLIGLVGLVALSIYLPILSLMGTIGK